MPTDPVAHFLSLIVSSTVLACWLALKPPKGKSVAIHALVTVGLGMMMACDAAMFLSEDHPIAASVRQFVLSWGNLLVRIPFLAAGLSTFFGAGSGRHPSWPYSSS